MNSRNPLVAYLLAAAASALPALGAQSTLAPRHNAPREILLPPPRRRPKRKPGEERPNATMADIARLEAAQVKRQRRAEKYASDVRAGNGLQLATPRRKV